MQLSPYTIDTLTNTRYTDLLREAENERRVAEATRGGRSLRVRLAAGLYALAARVEGHPRRTSHEGAPAAA